MSKDAQIKITIQTELDLIYTFTSKFIFYGKLTNYNYNIDNYVNVSLMICGSGSF